MTESPKTIIHTIPVPRGYTPEEAWVEISTMGRLVEYRWWKFWFRWPFVRWAIVVERREEETE